LFPGAAEPFLDLSTGINPNPYPLSPLSPELFVRLPDPDALQSLAGIAAKAYGAPSAAHVVPAPGTQILLPLAAGLVRPGRAAVLAPTYGEYVRAAALAGHAVTEAGDIAGLADADIVFVTNPNNPDGRLVARDDLIAAAKKLQTRGGVLVVDEAFMDVGPRGCSLGGEVSRGNIVVLRSFGKFFGLAGLRLGFALAAPPLAARLAALLGPWPVSAPALAIGAQALADQAWIDTTRRGLAMAAARLDAMLAGCGLDIVGGTSLFRLARTPAASELFHHLGRAGIWTRVFPEYATWLRFGLPAAEPDWQRLHIAMAAFHDNR
jgi:cobalamin biosynthetic protein CobC